MNVLKILLMKNQILDIKIFYVLIFVLSVFVGCDRDDPVGGEIIDDRAGGVVCDTLTNFIHSHLQKYSATGASDFLYAGSETDFRSTSLLSFEIPPTKTTYDSALFVFAAENKGDEELYLMSFSGEFEEDSVISYGYVDSHIGVDTLSDLPVWVEDTLSDETVLKFSCDSISLTNTVNIALCSHGETSVFYSKDSSKPPLLKLFRGPLLETVEPLKDAFVDTILSFDTTDIFIVSGSCVSEDSISLSDSSIDFTEVSLINNAVLYLPINDFSGPAPELCVRYKENTSIPHKIEGDTVKIEITKFVDEWITDEDRFIVLEGREGTLFTAEISRDITLEVVYTKKPGERI